jgi:HSP20 family molecular chaperone IbpA
MDLDLINTVFPRRDFFRDALFSPLLEDAMWKRTPSKLVESANHYKYYVKAPNVSPENVNIKFIEDRIVVEVTSEEHKEGDEDKVHWNEWWSGTVTSGVSFPSGSVNHEKTTAKINNGVIEIFIPKAEKPDKENKVVNVKIN